MRRRLALMVALGVVWAVGCTPVETVQSTTSWLPRRRLFQGPSGPDVVQVRLALLECPPGQVEWRYVNGDLWQLADESLIDEDRRQAMNESGFRVGKVGTQPPAKLLDLLTSQHFNPEPRELSFRAGDPKALTLGPTLRQCRYQLTRDGDPIVVDAADCQLAVVATRGTDGKTMLRLTPQVVHGVARNEYQVDQKAGSFVSLPERPTETYAQMGWEAELAVNEYLIVGCNNKRTESLGYQFFVRPDEEPPVQRLLVIKMGSAPPEAAAPPTPPGKPARLTPLALQAARGGPP
jgi:hypothetical protein